MDTLKIWIVNQSAVATNWLLHHTDGIEIVDSETPDVVVLQLSQQAKHQFLSQLEQQDNPIIRVGALCIDLTKRHVTLNNKAIHLTPTEYRLLCVLAAHVGAVVTHDNLMVSLNKQNSEHLLHVHMSNLRQKIEPNPNQPRYLMTVAGVGYRLIKPLSSAS